MTEITPEPVRLANKEPTPHGLPLRFTNLNVPTQGGSSGNEALVSTLSSSLADVVTLGPLRRVVSNAVMSKKEQQEQHVVAGAEGVVHQVSRFRATSALVAGHLDEWKVA